MSNDIDPYRTTDKTNRHDENGHEILNPTPLSPPVGYKPTLSLAEQIRQQVRQAKHLDDNEPETEEEADDFEIDEDPAPPSRWENDMIPSIKQAKARAQELERLFADAEAARERAKNVRQSVADPVPKPQGQE